jgi:hypothetical protein
MNEHLHLLEIDHQSHPSVFGKSNLRIVLQEENSGLLPIKILWNSCQFAILR